MNANKTFKAILLIAPFLSFTPPHAYLYASNVVNGKSGMNHSVYQNRKITGVIKDASGFPIIGANIFIIQNLFSIY